MRRTHLRGHRNILKRLLLHVAAFNLSLILRREAGVGTPRGLQDLRNRLFFCFRVVWMFLRSHCGKLGFAAGNFCRQISDSPVWGSGTERCLKKRNFYHGLLSGGVVRWSMRSKTMG